MLSNRQIIEEAPLQIYSSALVFSPMKSLVRKYYSGLILKWITRQPVTRDEWTPELFALEGHYTAIGDVVFSSNGAFIASSSSDGTICVWDALTGVEVYCFHEDMSDLSSQEDSVNWSFNLALSHDGTMLASESRESGVICLRTTATGKSMHLERRSRNGPGSLAFSTDGKALLFIPTRWASKPSKLPELPGLTDSQIDVWDTCSGMSLPYVPVDLITDGHAVAVDSREFANVYNRFRKRTHWMAFERSLNVITDQNIIMSKDKTQYSLPNGALVPDATIFTTLTTNGVDIWGELGTPAGWAVEDYFPNLRLTAEEPEPFVTAISPDGEKAATAYRYQSVVTMHTGTGARVTPLCGHSKAVTKLAFSPDGITLASGSDDGTVRLWNTALNYENFRRRYDKKHCRIPKSAADAEFVADTDLVLVFESLGFIVLRSVSTGLVLLPYEKSDVQWSEDGSLVGVLKELGRDPDPPKFVLQLWSKDLKDLKKQFDNVYQFAISPDGQHVAFSDEATTYIIDTANWEQVAVTNEIVEEMAFSADSNIMTYTIRRSYGPFIPYIWDVQSKNHIALDMRECEMSQISRDGKLAVFVEKERNTLWDVTHRKELASFPRAGYFPGFSPDGSYLVWWTEDERGGQDTLVSWKTKDGKELVPLHCPVASYKELFSPTGMIALHKTTKHEVYEIRVFNLIDGKQKGRILVDAPLENLRFSSDEKSLHCNRGQIALPFLKGRELPLKLFVGREWVFQGSQNLLWLPQTYQDVKVAVRGDTIVFACGDDWVEFLSLDLKRSPYML